MEYDDSNFFIRLVIIYLFIHYEHRTESTQEPERQKLILKMIKSP